MAEPREVMRRFSGCESDDVRCVSADANLPGARAPESELGRGRRGWHCQQKFAFAAALAAFTQSLPRRHTPNICGSRAAFLTWTPAASHSPFPPCCPPSALPSDDTFQRLTWPAPSPSVGRLKCRALSHQFRTYSFNFISEFNSNPRRLFSTPTPIPAPYSLDVRHKCSIVGVVISKNRQLGRGRWKG